MSDWSLVEEFHTKIFSNTFFYAYPKKLFATPQFTISSLFYFLKSFNFPLNSSFLLNFCLRPAAAAALGFVGCLFYHNKLLLRRSSLFLFLKVLKFTSQQFVSLSLMQLLAVLMPSRQQITNCCYAKPSQTKCISFAFKTTVYPYDSLLNVSLQGHYFIHSFEGGRS